MVVGFTLVHVPVQVGSVPPLVSVPPLRGGDFQGIKEGATDPMCFRAEHNRRTPALDIVSICPPSYPSAGRTRSILRWLFRVVDDDHIERRGRRFKFQAELILESREDRRAARAGIGRAGTGIGIGECVR